MLLVLLEKIFSPAHLKSCINTSGCLDCPLSKSFRTEYRFGNEFTELAKHLAKTKE